MCRFCSHEYTASNVDFALQVEPENAALRSRRAAVQRLRQERLATVPTILGHEKETRGRQAKGNQGKIMVKPCETVGKTMVKPWKTMVKPWKSTEKRWKNHRKSIEQPRTLRVNHGLAL